jgi:hypothetical protein
MGSFNSNGYSSNGGFKIGTLGRTKSLVNLDADVREHLDEMDELLGRKIYLKDLGPKFKKKKRGKKENDEDENGVSELDKIPETGLVNLLRLPLTPKKTDGGDEPWEDGSLLQLFNSLEETESDDDDDSQLTINDIIKGTPEMSDLYYKFKSMVDCGFRELPVNQRGILQITESDFAYQGIVSYLVAYGYINMQIRDANALMSFLRQSKEGLPNIAKYITISASRTILSREKLDVEGLNDDDSELSKLLAGLKISFQGGVFKPKALATVKKFIFGSPYFGWINKWIADNAVKNISEELKEKLLQRLINLAKSKIVNINEANSGAYISSILTNLNSDESYSQAISLDGYGEGDIIADEDFNVNFFVDEGEGVSQINVSNVKCAAQLFYSMTLGDELDVFNVVNYFTHKYLVRGGMEIKDRRLREDLQMYVFSNKFIGRNGRELDRTRPAERMMFYKQVFNYGSTKITDDLIVNDEFIKLWKVLILESARYLERAQESPNPINFVSRQNVVQAVEDLQYNLSTHCTGMVNVITPIIYQELDFVIKRIFKNKEVMNQVVPSGGSWWRVVENLYASMRSKRMKTTVINNKAEYGHDIIKAIAEYNPSTFQNDDEFSKFITSVDSFITTQSILQESLTDQVKKLDSAIANPDEMTHDDIQQKKIPSTGAPTPVSAGSDEWDF